MNQKLVRTIDHYFYRCLLKKNVLLNQLTTDKLAIAFVGSAVRAIVAAFQHNKNVLFCGNGGSAADAQHLSAELTGRFYLDRKPLNAEALHVNSSYLTAIANDYSYDEVFSRLVEAKGMPGGVVVGLSTSGNSPNVNLALSTARERGMVSIGFTGKSGGKMPKWCTYSYTVPSDDTPTIQEIHMLLGHMICALVEKILFTEEK